MKTSLPGDSSDLRDGHGALCDAVGDVMSDAIDRAPAAGMPQWLAIESSLRDRRLVTRAARFLRCPRRSRRWTSRRVWPAVTVAAAAAWLLWGRGHPRLTYVTEGCEVAPRGAVTAGAAGGGRITFNDGSTIALAGGARARVSVPEHPSSVGFILESGAAELDVVHGRRTNWVVAAGPFRVEVKGTRFRVGWSPDERHFRLEMRRGEVVVSGPSLRAARTLGAGQVLDAVDDDVNVDAATATEAAGDEKGATPTGAAADGQSSGGSPTRVPETTIEADAERPAAPPRRTSLVSPRDSSSALRAVRRTGPSDPPPTGCDSSSVGAASGQCPATHANAASEKDDTMDKNEPSKTSRVARTIAVVAAAGSLGLSAPPALGAPPDRPGSPVAIGADGKLDGPMSGYAWVAAGAAATVSTPSPCDPSGCFKDTKGQLCTRGTLPALQCTGQGTAQYACNWAANWGAEIGMNPSADGGPWQSGAPSSVSIAYHGGRGTYRLNAHLAGDPASKVYCFDAYQTGQVVRAGQLKTACWGDGGDALADFQRVDQIGLEITSAETPVSFDYCVSAIAVNGTAGRGGDNVYGNHVSIGDNGKLGGEMTGYAWVASGARATLSSPQPCNQNGCFRNTQGRLCVKGTLPPLACTGQGTSQLSCDWQADWGAMIGMSANLAGGPWGASAPSTVVVSFAGPPADYRLMAHVAGAPDGEAYCIDGYRSGQAVDARMLKSKCWAGGGDTLSSYQVVDKIGLQVISAEKEVPVDVCLSDIVVR